jgi:hypothetical protein
MQSAASAGVAIPPAVLRHPAHELDGSLEVLRLAVQLVGIHCAESLDRSEHGAHVRNRVDDVACPRFALRPDHRGALADAAKRLADVRATTDERDGELPLVDVIRRVRRRQNLGLVDVVDLERLQDLRLDEVADARLRHDGDAHGLLNLDHLVRVRHPSDAAFAADVRRNPLERHDRAGARLLGDPRLIGVGDVHDHPALQHLGEAALDPHRPDLSHRR